MTIVHHPTDELLGSFAAGNLDQATQLVIAAHVSMCPCCQRLVSAFEQLGGTLLEAVDPVGLAPDAFDAAMWRIERQFEGRPGSARSRSGDDARLPRVLDYYDIGPVRWVAPGVSLRPIVLPGGGRARAFLLKSAPGTRMLEHTHTDTELTCVLEGSFSHQGGHFGPGDFDLGDEAVDHQPVVGPDGPCLCLVAMTGKLRINGLLGRLIEPFIRL